jgi:hypothetical protein
MVNLLQTKIDASIVILDVLDAEKYQVSTALWLSEDGMTGWKYIIASRWVDTHGPKSIYLKVNKIIGAKKISEAINILDIAILSPNDNRIRSLKFFISTGPGKSKIELMNCNINGVFIGGAIIFRNM